MPLSMGPFPQQEFESLVFWEISLQCCLRRKYPPASFPDEDAEIFSDNGSIHL